MPLGHVFDTSSGDGKAPSVPARLRSRIRHLAGSRDKLLPVPTAVVWDWIANAIRLRIGLHPDAHHAVHSLQEQQGREAVLHAASRLARSLGSGAFAERLWLFVSVLKLSPAGDYAHPNEMIDMTQPRQTGASFLFSHAAQIKALVIDDDIGTPDG